MKKNKVENGYIFTQNEKLLLTDGLHLLEKFCSKSDVEINYYQATKPYWRQYREYCELQMQYKSRYMKWVDTKYIRAGRTIRKDREFHYVLCSTKPEGTGEDGDKIKAPPEPHDARKFMLIVIILVEMLNDDGIRRPQSKGKIKEYRDVLKELFWIVDKRIRNQYQQCSYLINVHQSLFGNSI